jgi:hypothetical protein
MSTMTSEMESTPSWATMSGNLPDKKVVSQRCYSSLFAESKFEILLTIYVIAG